jgi:hypothetical protein
MVVLDYVDTVHELDVDPEIDIEQRIVFDHEFTSSGAHTYHVDHVMTPDRHCSYGILR